MEDEVRGLLALFDSDAHRPGEHRQPRRAHRARVGPHGGRPARLLLADRAPSPPDRRSHPPPPGHLRGPGRAGLGADHRAARTGSPPPPPSWPARAGSPDRPDRRSRGRRDFYPGGPFEAATWGSAGTAPPGLANEEPGHMADTGDRPTPDEGGAPDYSLLSVIVPVFNERSTVAELSAGCGAVEVPVDVEVIVVDDGSSDGTDKILGALGDSTVRVITPRRQPGQGRGRPDRPRGGAWRPRAHPGRRPRVRPGGLAEAARTRFSGARPASSTAAGSPASARTCCRSHWMGNRSCRS